MKSGKLILGDLNGLIAKTEFHSATRLLIHPNARTQELGRRLRAQSRYLAAALPPGRN